MDGPVRSEGERTGVATRGGRAEADAVRAARSPWVWTALSWYLTWYVSRHFHAMRIAADGLPRVGNDGPVIVYSNHPSWWDPVTFILLARQLFRSRESFGPMEAESLGRYSVFRKMGVFGIDPSHPRGAARFLRVAAGLLDRPSTALWITAEGGFVDPRQRPLRLRPGVAHLARRAGPGTVLPLAIEYTFWDERTPELLVRFGEPMAFDRSLSVEAWDARLVESLTSTMDALKRGAMMRDPAEFTTLSHGTAGVGGIYDIWRRLRAAIRGERATLAHTVRVEKRHGDDLGRKAGA